MFCKYIKIVEKYIIYYYNGGKFNSKGGSFILFLKEANLDDYEKEYEAMKQFPADENGFINEYYGVSKQEFVDNVLPTLINYSKGIDLPDGYVPCTYYFLWDDEEIVGLFKVRHWLNEALKRGSGHIGYGILKQYRKKGYATKGLALAIEKLKGYMKEDEVYMSCSKHNPASLKVQQNNGASIVYSDEEEYYTRIKI